MRAGLFAQWQPHYADHGIATFPVCDKRPAVRGYLRLGLAASEQLTIKFPDHDAFGLACRRSRITVLDIDEANERLLADCLSEFGPTPLIIRSCSGHFQAWYRHNGEARRVRPDPSRNVDILGDGYVVAPPSRDIKGSYSIIEGSLDDLAKLPPMLRAPVVQNAQAVRPIVERGRRNQTLWRACMQIAAECDDITELLRRASEMNRTMFYEPLADDEVLRVAASAWEKEKAGENWFGRGGRVVLTQEEIDVLASECPDALLLLTLLRRRHWGDEPFFIANAWAEAIGMPLKRFAAARAKLLELHKIKRLRGASRNGGPATYRFNSGRN